MFNFLGRPRGAAALAAASAIAIVASVSSAYAQEQQRTFNIPAQRLSSALIEFSRQANIMVIADPTLVNGRQAPAVQGEFTPSQALDHLLAGSGLSAAQRADGSFVLADISSPTQLGAAEAVPSDRNNQEEIVVTGTRLRPTALGGAQQVQSYDREAIQSSGQTSVSGFLGTLPTVSTTTVDSGIQTTYAQTTVQLRGLPAGTTLVLLDGRRLESSGLGAAPGQGNFFDLNTIPVEAIERIDVLAEGSSAIYGSDAIAGVVNIVLRKDFEGFELNASYGAASGVDEYSAAAVAGHTWQGGNIVAIASYQSRGSLLGGERDLTANQDYTAFGGFDYRRADCSPGNVFSTDGSPLPGAPSGESFAAVSASASGNPQITGFQGTFGQLNLCSYGAFSSLVTQMERAAVYGAAEFDLTLSTTLFVQLLYSHTDIESLQGPASLYADPFFQQYAVSASNPYNPFGVDVNVGLSFPTLPPLSTRTTTDFVRGIIGLRGEWSNGWDWETASWFAQDNTNALLVRGFTGIAIQNALNSTDPLTALNPFVADLPGSPALLSLLDASRARSDNEYEGRTLGLNAFTTGELFQIPAGAVEVVIGTEYIRDDLSFSYDGYIAAGFPDPDGSYDRQTLSLFGEARIPLLASLASVDQDLLTLTLAGRFDSYYDYDEVFTPQVGLVAVPAPGLLIRASYSEAFKAPSLFNLYSPARTFNQPITDPANGQSYLTTGVSGGSLNVAPETGESYSLGLHYVSPETQALNVGLSWWRITENDSIQSLSPVTLLSNEALFPDRITRDPGTGLVTQIDATYTNFGVIEVTGLDLQAAYTFDLGSSEITPSLVATYVYDYQTQLFPGQPFEDRTGKANDDGNWAPEWKATATLAWEGERVGASIAARYVGPYQDYNSTTEIGNIVFIDVNARVRLNGLPFAGTSDRAGSYLEVGAVNLFDELPEYSNFGFGYYGFDPAQADIRGRFVYARVGVRF